MGLMIPENPKPWFRMSVAELEAELGIEPMVECDGCHKPIPADEIVCAPAGERFCAPCFKECLDNIAADAALAASGGGIEGSMTISVRPVGPAHDRQYWVGDPASPNFPQLSLNLLDELEQLQRAATNVIWAEMDQQSRAGAA